MAVHYWLLECEPRFRDRLRALELATARLFLARAPARLAEIRIPVVVHVVYRAKEENVSDSQVRSQIAALDRDFAARNPDRSRIPAVWKGLAADSGIRFALATTDPRGAPSTGITRTKTTRRSFPDDDSVKFASSGGASAWPRSRYLNVWVCNLEDYLGYAQFPGGPAKTDGVVISNGAFGTRGTADPPFHRGRTAVHEVGHWLNLRHIWGDTEDCSGGDLVSDTPNQAGPNFGKPKFPQVSCGNAPNGDLFVDYMDYVDDDAMVLFTPQQVARMRATLEGPRRSIGR
jgi:hypothetical protein